MEIQAELGRAKQELQKWKQVRKEQVSFINFFGEQVCKTLHLGKDMLRLRADEVNVKDYLNGILELVIQGFTN